MEPVEWIAREIICSRREEELRSPGFERSHDFTITRESGKLVWSTFNLEADRTLELNAFELWFGDHLFAIPTLRNRVTVCAGDVVKVTYTLWWDWRDGDDDAWWRPGPPGHGRIIPVPAVPHLSDWHKLSFALSC